MAAERHKCGAALVDCLTPLACYDAGALGGWALESRAMYSRVLVLNRNYEPLNVCNVRRALVLLLQEKAHALASGRDELRTPNAAFVVPTVIRLFDMVRRPAFARRLSRREVFLRDGFTCQYCGTPSRVLTIDHVLPRVKGGEHTWHNVVAACVSCNHKKAGRTPEQARMFPLRKPVPPRANPYHQFLHREIPEAWQQFLPWAVSQPIASRN